MHKSHAHARAVCVCVDKNSFMTKNVCDREYIPVNFDCIEIYMINLDSCVCV